jgi:hypothetical protein
VTLTEKQVLKIMRAATHELHQQAMRARGTSAAIHTLELAKTWQSGPGSQLGKGGGPRSSDVSDPTGSNVVRFPDPGDRYLRDLTAVWYAIEQNIKDLHDITAGIHARAANVTRATVTQTRQCVLAYCGDDATPALGEVPKRGRCKACNEYFAQHGVDPDKRTVDARRRKREQRERMEM